nr:MAG TPA_asm: hypothetical protein [Caudoviricetes sp.]
MITSPGSGRRQTAEALIAWVAGPGEQSVRVTSVPSHCAA